MKRWFYFFSLLIGCVIIFVGRAILAQTILTPRTFDIFEVLIVIGALIILILEFRNLIRRDVIVAIGAGLLIGFQLPFTVLFTPYPFFQTIGNPVWQGVIRGLFTTIALLGGLVIMRCGGPVQVRLANDKVKKCVSSLIFGVVIGFPFAVLNIFANQLTNKQAIDWQSPFIAASDALQPAIFEDVVFRFALIGLFWWLLRRVWTEPKAALLAGFLATMVHTYAHMDDLFLSQPIIGIGTGAVMFLIWGIPMTYLALRRDLESSISFHWIQDVMRFFAGF